MTREAGQETRAVCGPAGASTKLPEWPLEVLDFIFLLQNNAKGLDPRVTAVATTDSGVTRSCPRWGSEQVMPNILGGENLR